MDCVGYWSVYFCSLEQFAGEVEAIPGTPIIGTLNEKPLHEALKRWYTRPGDLSEVPVDGFVADIVRGHDGLIIEIQTKNFSSIKRKLEALLISHPVRLVYPIPHVKWIVKIADDGSGPVSRRKSPRHGTFEDIFYELVRLPGLLENPSFSMELLLIEEEEVRRHDGVRGWRRKGWVTEERRLLRVIDSRILRSPADLDAFIPAALAEPFSVSELAAAASISRTLAGKMVYCMRRMGCVAPAGKRANAILYARRAT
ncbi:MAG: hypothetical protein A4E28_01334 [Methanocella sp. PtaU1.Bin125]|nr:MAG: hypothetical protein A4E28_01334 [Methanocella sp. PtaU1.Bin125]